MFYPINLIDCSEYVLNLNFDATNTLQTSWQRDNKRLGMLQKQMHSIFYFFHFTQLFRNRGCNVGILVQRREQVDLIICQYIYEKKNQSGPMLTSF